MRAIKIKASGKNGFGKIKFFGIARAIIRNMRIVTPGQSGGGLGRHRALRAGDLAQIMKRLHRPVAACRKAASQTGQVGPFGKRMKGNHRRIGRAACRHHLKNRGRRRLKRVINFRITFIDQQQEIMLHGKRQCFFEIGLIGHRALRIGRIAQIKRAHARQRISIKRVQIGQEICLRGRCQIMRLCACRHGGAGINLIKRVRHGHHPIGFWGCDLRGQKQPLAGAVERQDLMRLRHASGNAKAPLQPTARRGLPIGRAGNWRVAAILFDIFADSRKRKRGWRMLRLAQCQ